jgi:hypothetical protein
MVLCFQMQRGIWREIGRTEVLKNENPSFKKSISVFFKFEEKQELKFVVLNLNLEKDIDISIQKEIGITYCKIADIVASKKSTLTKDLMISSTGKKTTGNITMRVEGDAEGSFQYTIQLSGTNIGKSIFLILKTISSDYWIVFSIELTFSRFCPHFKD